MKQQTIQKKVVLGMHEEYLQKMVPCALYIVNGHTKHSQIARIIYDLFKMVGEPCCPERVAESSSYSYLTGTVSSRGGYGFCYATFDPTESHKEYADTWEPWQVPCWAIALSTKIMCLVNKAEDIGREHGYNSGIGIGKSFVRQLASGELTSINFQDADGRDDRRLTAKKW